MAAMQAVDAAAGQLTPTQNLREGFPSFTGEVHFREESPPKFGNYEQHAYQYATTSHGIEGAMQPAAIIYPSPADGDDDVKLAIKYASEKGIAIAIRTGGHQYSGASSTGGGNIQLDLSKAYKTCVWKNFDEEGEEVEVGVSMSLDELNAQLASKGRFVPHGQCRHVHVGGHAQTGGYGQLGRAFGLFGDHITAIRLIDADQHIRVIRRGAEAPRDRDLFWAVLGGSPGNLGVLTHVTLRVRKDSDHPNSRGLKIMVLYGKDQLKELLDIKADMAADDELAGNFDLCISVISNVLNLGKDYGMTDAQLKALTTSAAQRKADLGKLEGKTPEDTADTKGIPIPDIPGILVYAQWADVHNSTSGYTEDVRKWFHKIWEACGVMRLDIGHRSRCRLGAPLWDRQGDRDPTPMSKLTGQWVYKNVREHKLPFHKRTFVTRSTTLNQTNWAQFTTDQIHALLTEDNGCNVVAQIQHFGGANSQVRLNGGSGETAYSWRDATVTAALDAFYDEGRMGADGRSPRQHAHDWQVANARGLLGDRGNFSDTDVRVLWGTYHNTLAEKSMGTAWPFYHESLEKYQRLCAIKERVDPGGVFSPNEFCVGAPAADTTPRPGEAEVLLGGPPSTVYSTGDGPTVDGRFAEPMRRRLAAAPGN